MRFVSHSPAFMVQVLAEKVHFSQYGDRIVDREGFIARFNQNDLNDEDVVFAERVFNAEGLHGRQTFVDEVTFVPLLDRLSVFDTDEEAKRERWQDQTLEDQRGVFDKKAYIEHFLAAHSIDHPDFRQVVSIPVEPPWPNYLAYGGTPQQLLQKLELEGFDLNQVLRFEEQLSEPRDTMISLLRERIRDEVREASGAVEVPA